MTRKLALSLAAALTAFTLIMVAVLTVNVFRPQSTANAATQTAAAQTEVVPADPTAGVSAAIQAAVAERDAYYQQQLQAANARLTEANSRLQQAYADLDQARAAGPAEPAPQPTATAAPAQEDISQIPAPAYTISPRRAALIALSAAPGASLTMAPSLVSFQGTPAYEVTLDAGQVYVDAATGDVLYNGAISTISNAPQPREAGHDRDDDDHDDD